MNATSVKRLMQKGAETRQAIQGVNQLGEAQKMDLLDESDPIDVYYSPIKDVQQLEDANMKLMHDGILRVIKSKAPDFTPRLGQTVKLLKAKAGTAGDITVMFNELGNSGLNPEWVIGCGQIN